MGWPAYQRAARCTGRTPNGSNEFMRWAVYDFGQGARNLGIYNCRAIRGKTNTSLHGEGRAVDIGFSGSGNPAGTRLLNTLLPHVGELGIQMIIWNRRMYSARYPRGARYTGAIPHTDHLHIELTWAAANGLTRDRIRQIVGGRGTPQPGPPVDWAAVRRYAAGYMLPWMQAMPNLDGNSRDKGQIGVLQKSLNVATGSKLKEDGIYGPATINAVLNFQKFMNALGANIKDFPGAAHEGTRWWLCTALMNIRDGKA